MLQHILSSKLTWLTATFSILAAGTLSSQPHPLDVSGSVIKDDMVEVDEIYLPKHAVETYIGHLHKDEKLINDKDHKSYFYRVQSYDDATSMAKHLRINDAIDDIIKDKALKKELEKLVIEGAITRSITIKGKFAKLVISKPDDISNSFIIRHDNTGYNGEWTKNAIEKRQNRAHYKIENGLYFDSKKANLTSRIIRQIHQALQWDIDFTHDLRVGDTVTVIYDEFYHDGEWLASNDLLAIELVNRGTTHRSIRYRNGAGEVGFYNSQGQSMKKAFTRTPIKNARISSHYNPSRFHPVLHKIKAHKGTDFAARPGTPIQTTGYGKVKFKGWKSGYGRTVIIAHADGMTTLYAHMKGYKSGLKVGQKVSQGDTIGFVGSSGRTTGPHLHYEFMKDGKHANPMTVKLPKGLKLEGKELVGYRSLAVDYVTQLNILQRLADSEIEWSNNFGG